MTIPTREPLDASDGYTVRRRFLECVSGSVDYPTADAAWRLVLDAWRVIDVASARASVPANPTREEWMAALRIATFRLDHGITERPA